MKNLFRQWLISSGILLVVFSPLVLFSYAHLDQYRYFDMPREERLRCAQDPQFTPILTQLARPVAAGIECIIWSSVNERSDLRWFRILSVITVGLFAAMVSLVAQTRFQISSQRALVLGLWCGMLPGFNNLISMTNIAPILGAAFSVAAFALADQTRSAIRLSFALLCLVIALFCYPAVGCTGLLFIGLLWWRKNLSWREMIWRSIPQVALCFAAVLVFFAIVKFAFQPTLQTEYYSFSVATNILKRLNYGYEFVKRSTNLWLIFDIKVTWVLFILWALWMMGRSRQTAYRIGATFLVAFIAGAPIFASGMAEYMYRISIPVEACFLAAFWMILGDNRKRVMYVTIFASAVTCLTAFSHVSNSRAEFDRVSQQLKKWHQEGRLSQAKRIWYVGPKRLEVRSGLNGIHAETDEFNTGTTLYPVWALAAAFQAAAREGDNVPQRFSFCREETAKTPCVPNTPNTIGIYKVGDLSAVKEEPGDLIFDGWSVIGWKRRP